MCKKMMNVYLIVLKEQYAKYALDILMLLNGSVISQQTLSHTPQTAVSEMLWPAVPPSPKSL